MTRCASTENDRFVVVGLDHRVAPVGIREAMAFPADTVAAELVRLRAEARASEALILSTCNRVEVWAVGGASVREDVASFLLERAAAMAQATLTPSPLPSRERGLLYTLTGEQALRHVFRVAAGLESLIVGEPQILGQVKGALRLANDAAAVGPRLGAIGDRALAVAKRVRSQTGIGRHAVSVSHVAVELALKIFGGVRGARVVIVGAGKMSGLAARRLAREGAELTVVGRTEARARELAALLGGRALPLDALAGELAHADIVLTGTGAPTTIIGRDEVEKAVRARGGRPLFLIDIAVPRDVDPGVRDLPAVFLYDLDDLDAVAQANLRERRREAAVAEKVVERELQAFLEDGRARSAVPLVVALRQRAEEIRRREMEKARLRMGPLTTDQENVLEAVTAAIVNKLLHAPTVCLKEMARQGTPPEESGLVRTALGLG